MYEEKQLPFTQEQLLQLVDFPPELLQVANKKLSSELMRGKAIGNQFSYFLSICRNLLKDQSSSRKETSSYSKPSKSDSVSKETVQRQRNDQEIRYQAFLDKRQQKRDNRLMQLGYDPGGMSNFDKAQVIQVDQLTYYTGIDAANKKELIKKEENVMDTDFIQTIIGKETNEEFALNFERLIHKRTLEDPIFAAKCARFDRNPMWAKLSDSQKNDIWIKAHTKDCSCRKNEVAGLILPEIAQKLIDTLPVTTVTPLEEKYNFNDLSLWEEI